MNKNNCLYCLSLFFAIVVFGSCSSNKDLLYFKNIARDSVSVIQNSAEEFKIRKNDILQITITSADEVTTRIFNSNNSTLLTGNTANSNSPLVGYLVDEKGDIKIPLIGSVKAEGLTKSQLTNAITTELISKKLTKDPVVSIRIVNYKVTVLGEVNRPGVIPVINENITILEALGMAGDLTPYALRKSLLLVREKEGKREYIHFDLDDSKLFSKNYYYLQNQDVIYVSPNNAKAGATDRSTQLLPIIVSSLSFIAVIFTQIIRK